MTNYGPTHCGTIRAVWRHRYHKQPLDEACAETYREYERGRDRTVYNRTRSQTRAKASLAAVPADTEGTERT